MQEKVRRFIERKEQERAERRKLHLLRLGLSEKEYSEEQHPDYPYWDPEVDKYYRVVPIDVTDEEYVTICSYVTECSYVIEGDRHSSSNPIATALKVIAWIILIGGFFAGLIVANEYIYDFEWGIAISYWVGSIISGMMFLGFAEIITLLQAMVNKE